MSSDADAPARVELTEVGQYVEKMADVEDTVEWIDDKLENGRIRDPERARARQGYLRLKIQAIGEWRKLKEAGDLADLRQKVDNLADEVDGGR